MGQQALLCGLPVLWIFLLWIQGAYNINCIRRACDEGDRDITCNQSLILVSDVTNWRLERDEVAFENMKRACMGKSSCDPSRVCGQENKKTLVVHYFCVDANLIRSKSCNRWTENVNWESGYIQSPAYPAAMSQYQPCTWRIEAPNGSVVVLSLHDIAISGSREECNGGLMVTGNSCDDEGHMYAPRLLCGGDNVNSLMRCGKVDIELSPSQLVFPLRFWLSFYVHPKYQPSNLQASVLPCSGWIYSMGTEFVRNNDAEVSLGEETTPFPGETSETNTELLIIMLSVISGISVVLLVILIIVCVRCRLLQSPHSEHVYYDPSPSLQAHYEYIASLESEKPRPQLADGYFEVADALPFTQRGDTPTSPAYAEVEQFPQLRKAHLGPSAEDSPKGLKPPGGELRSTENLSKSSGEKVRSPGSETARGKRGVLMRLKGDKKGEKDRRTVDRNSTGPKVIEATVKKDWYSNQDSSDPLFYSQSVDDANSCTYEQIEEFSPLKQFPLKADRNPPVPANHPLPLKDGASNSSRNAGDHIKATGRVKDSAKVFSEKFSEVLPTSPVPSKVSSGVTSSTLKKGSTTQNPVSLAERSKTLPHKQFKGQVQTGAVTNNNYKRAAYKDVPRTRGIVKNGIQKFEQSSSVS